MPEDRDDTLGEAIEDARRRAQDDQRWTAHLELHDLAAKLRGEDAERRWKAHEELHRSGDEAIRTAIKGVDRERQLHVEGHDAAHSAHSREHILEADARDKAEQQMDRRLEGMNEFRQELRDQAATFVRRETFDQLLERVVAIEKLDIKGEGRALGQGATVGIIVGAIGLVGTILGIVIIAANFLSAS